MLVVQGVYRSSSSSGSRIGADRRRIRGYQMQSDNSVTFEELTEPSPYATMHVDVCSIVEDKRANMIIIFLHVQGGKNAKADDMSSSVRMVNQKVLAYTPCSVALLVNQGLGMSNKGVSCLILFFISGSDDREALSYAWRMSALPEVHLTVVRLIAGEHVETEVKMTFNFLKEERSSTMLITMHERQTDMDEEFIGEFKYRTTNNNSISYSEAVVNNSEEMLTSIRHIMEQNSYEMCIVGQGDRQTSPIVSGLSSIVEFEELGAIGDAIMTSNFAPNCSILVIQQYCKPGLHGKRGGNDLLADMFN